MIGRLSERLQNVIEAAQNVGAGNYNVHLHDKNPDDIGELSRNFQSMVGKVAASQERLENMSLHDALTGALNRMGLDDAIGKWLRENPQGKGALVSLDLDGFKFINDLYGHMAGDEALRALTQDLRESFGSQHIIGRNGGDEFIVFMTDTTPELAQQTIDAFSRKIKMFNFDGETHVFSVSIGYTLYQGDNTPLSKLFHQADTALYAVKLKGRNHYRIYKETMENISRSSLGFNLDNITRNLPTALFVCEAKEHGQILFVNKAMLDLFECHNTGEFMSYTQEKEENVVCPCDRERVSKLIWQQTAAAPEATRCLVYRIRTLKGNIKQVYSVWRQADNPNYGKVFYASIVDYQIIKGHIPELDEHPTC